MSETVIVNTGVDTPVESVASPDVSVEIAQIQADTTIKLAELENERSANANEAMVAETAIRAEAGRSIDELWTLLNQVMETQTMMAAQLMGLSSLIPPVTVEVTPPPPVEEVTPEIVEEVAPADVAVLPAVEKPRRKMRLL